MSSFQKQMTARVALLGNNQELLWASIPIEEVQKNDFRLVAKAYNLDSLHAKELLKKCKWPLKNLGGVGGLAESFYPGRFRRLYIEPYRDDAIGFLGSAEMLCVKPDPVKFLSRENSTVDECKVGKHWILLSRSGTIGNVSFVGRTLEKFLVSEHAIRIKAYEYPGYLYAFLKTQTGRAIVQSNIHGAVISQIEPEDVDNISVPFPSEERRKEIHELVSSSFELRDESNDLIDRAHALLQKELKLPPIHKIIPDYFKSDMFPELRVWSTPSVELNNRLDGSYHLPIVKKILEYLYKNANCVKELGNENLTEAIVLPGRFKRNYVEEGYGRVFLGGKQIYELDPANKKYLSLLTHGSRIKEQLELRENMILVTASGTIGKVNIVPKHWEKWTMNQHVLRVVPNDSSIAGYLYAWLSSDYGYQLIRRFTYGAVVDEVDSFQLSQVEVPFLKNESAQRQINDWMLEANQKRYEAYLNEQDAIKKINEVIHEEV